MPDQPKPTPGTPAEPIDPAVYGGQWGGGDKQKEPGVPPPDSPGRTEAPPGKT
jgi:hypothetical protein